eukprot:gene13306-28191_t
MFSHENCELLDVAPDNSESTNAFRARKKIFVSMENGKLEIINMSAPPDIDSMYTLKVDNITYRTSIDDLKEEFKRFGDVGDVYIPRSFGTGEPRGFAFVRFTDKRDAEDAMDAMDGKVIDGREIRIQLAKRKRPDNPKSYFSRERDRDRDRRSYDRDDRRGRNDRDRDSHRDRSRERERDRSRERDRDRDLDRYRGRVSSSDRDRDRNAKREQGRGRSGGGGRDRSKDRGASRSRSRSVSRSRSRSRSVSRSRSRSRS